MTYDNPSLLAAIREQPGDDNLRLVYSDWLEDHNQPERAEFVRLQCANPVEIAPFGSPDPDSSHPYYSFPTNEKDMVPSLAQQFALYQKSVRKWNGAIHRRLRGSPLQHRVGRRSLIRGWSYRRGFPSTLWARLDDLGDHLDWLQAIGPIERLVIVGTTNPADLIRFVQTLETHPLWTVRLTVPGMLESSLRLIVENQRERPSWLNQLAQVLFRR